MSRRHQENPNQFPESPSPVDEPPQVESSLYNQLHRIAAGKMRLERGNHTLQPTALVHEAYLRLVDGEKVHHWNSRGHFFAAAAQAMRQILVENARRKSRRNEGKDTGRTIHK